MTTPLADASVRARLAAAAPVSDAVLLCAFVLLGRQSHDLAGGAGWFFTVVWPFLAGWFVAALALGVYARRQPQWARLTAAIVIGDGLALVLRVTVTQRTAPAAFVIVALVFTLVTMLGWRVLVNAVVRLSAR